MRINTYTLACLLALTLSLATATVSAQADLQIGAMVQPIFTGIWNQEDFDLPDDQYQPELLGGISAGLFAGYKWNFLAARVQVLYSQQGGKFSFLSEDGSTRINQVNRLEYLKVPLLIGYSQDYGARKWVFSAYAGVQAALLINADSYNDNTAYEAPLSSSIISYPSETETYEPLDLGAVIDLGFEARLTYNLYASFRFRADMSLTDIEDKNTSYTQLIQGEPVDFNYWDELRGSGRNASRNITAGVYIGLMFLPFAE